MNIYDQFLVIRLQMLNKQREQTVFQNDLTSHCKQITNTSKRQYGDNVGLDRFDITQPNSDVYRKLSLQIFSELNNRNRMEIKYSLLLLNLLDRYGLNQYNQFVMLAAVIQQRLTQLVSVQKVDLKQLRQLCLKQEEAVIHYMTSISNFDIYIEIGKVCPSQAHLRTLAQEELTALVSLTGQINAINRGNPSPKSDADDEADMLTEEQERPTGYFSLDQPSIKNFMDIEENDDTWEFRGDIEQEIMQ